MKTQKQPILFVGHGNPLNAIEENSFTRALNDLDPRLMAYEPKAVLIVSAHWLTEGTKVTAMNKPKTIHDFYGFPPTLHAVEYPANGSYEYAKEICETLQLGEAGLDQSWGLDHGAWSVLIHIFPRPEIPILQLSLDVRKENKNHLELAKKLATLREQGFLIIGSGNVVHNLRLMKWGQKDFAYDWAQTFDQSIQQAIKDKDVQHIASGYMRLSQHELSVPSSEHYWPLIYVVGAVSEREEAEFIYTGMEFGSISMTSAIYELKNKT